MKKIIISSILGLCISLIVLIFSVEYFSFNTEYIHENVSEDLNVVINNDDIYKTVKSLTDYLKQDIDNLEFTITKNNEEVNAFNEIEIIHMIDVKKIYENISKLKYILIALIGTVIFIIRKKYLVNSFYYSTIISLVFTVILGILITMDFNKTFIKFHELIFTNEFWILNPKTDLLIQLVPSKFFSDIAKNIVILFLGINVALSLIGFQIKKILINANIN